MSATRRREQRVIWHDVECGAYAADLPLWAELAAPAAGRCSSSVAGTGRVALHLARRGTRVVGGRRRARSWSTRSRPGRSEPASRSRRRATSAGFELDRRFALVMAPMQLIQMLGGPERRRDAACASAART